MTDRLRRLSERDLVEIALAIRSGRLSAPFTTVALQRIVSRDVAPDVAATLQWLSHQGFGPEQIAVTLELLRSDRQHRPGVEELLELVTTGPEVSGVNHRDTSVVVRELFANAQESVLIAGYAVYQGQRVFQALADRMLEKPDLRVRLFLDIQRGMKDSTASSELIQRFSLRFRQHQWPKDRPLPAVFFDPRSLAVENDERSCLHAKCVVVDGTEVFVSSANFTEAAQQRNLEIGFLIRHPDVADRIVRYFEALLANSLLVPVI